MKDIDSNTIEVEGFTVPFLPICMHQLSQNTDKQTLALN